MCESYCCSNICFLMAYTGATVAVAIAALALFGIICLGIRMYKDVFHE